MARGLGCRDRQSPANRISQTAQASSLAPLIHLRIIRALAPLIPKIREMLCDQAMHLVIDLPRWRTDSPAQVGQNGRHRIDTGLVPVGGRDEAPWRAVGLGPLDHALKSMQIGFVFFDGAKVVAGDAVCLIAL